MYNHNANFTHCCQVCVSLKKQNKTNNRKKNYDLYETYQQSLTVSIRLSFLTSVHEKEHNNRNNE